MTNTFTLLANQSIGNEMEIPTGILKQAGIKPGNNATLKFGNRSVQVTVSETENKAGSLSQNTINALLLPLGANFEMRTTDNQIKIGPYLGILAAIKEVNLKRKLKDLKKVLVDDPSLTGVVVAFSIEGINTTRDVISGYVYNSVEKKWVQGIYPYPNAIYKRMPLRKSLLDHLKNKIGNRIFNENVISKWRVHHFLSQDEKMKPYLPSTIIYKSSLHAIRTTKRWKSVFLKPFNGSFGEKIYQISLQNGQYILRTRVNGENLEKNFSANELRAYLKKVIGRRKYIIQQRLNLKFKNNSVIDYRLYLAKNQSGQWQCTGWVAKSGVPNSIVSNRSNGGTVKPAFATMQESFGLNPEAAESLKQRVFSIACKAADCLEKKSGILFGYLGVDMAIDTNQSIWIIEMNHRFVDDTLPLAIEDTALYSKIQNSYLIYLKYLSGF